MSKFMYGMLRRNHILIKIDIADLIDETVDLTFRGGELLGYIRSFCLFILSLNVKRIMCSILFLRIIQIFSSELNITINNSKFIFPYFYNNAIIKVCKPFPIFCIIPAFDFFDSQTIYKLKDLSFGSYSASKIV